MKPAGKNERKRWTEQMTEGRGNAVPGTARACALWVVIEQCGGEGSLSGPPPATWTQPRSQKDTRKGEASWEHACLGLLPTQAG